MKEFRITTANLNITSPDDCVLDANDPIHELAKVSAMGGIGTDAALAVYNNANAPVVQGTDKGRIAREQNIKPGTDAWFKHWYGDKR